MFAAAAKAVIAFLRFSPSRPSISPGGKMGAVEQYLRFHHSRGDAFGKIRAVELCVVDRIGVELSAYGRWAAAEKGGNQQNDYAHAVRPSVLPRHNDREASTVPHTRWTDFAVPLSLTRAADLRRDRT